MSGYDGYSMSNRAREAYECGEMPKSQWTKQAILCAVDNPLISKLTLKELRMYLDRSSWHHTSSYYNETIFYELDVEALEALTEDDINLIISQRPKRERKVRSKEPKLAPMYVSAIVCYSQWEGTRQYPKEVYYTRFVTFMSDKKLVRCGCSDKRLSSLRIKAKIEQKTKFASFDRVLVKIDKKYRAVYAKNCLK